MENFFTVVGTVVFTSKTLYWVSGLGYIFVSVTALISAHILYMTEDFGGSLLGCAEYRNGIYYMSQWVLWTNVIALLSGLGFYYGEKGGTIGVISMFAFILNFLQNIALFIYAQVKVFDSETIECRESTPDQNTSFPRQMDACFAYILI